MVVEGVAAEGDEDQVPPAGVGGGLGLEDDWDEEADVLGTPSLVGVSTVKVAGEKPRPPACPALQRGQQLRPVAYPGWQRLP